jgi:transcriptional regulator with XRE-family HTH domain
MTQRVGRPKHQLSRATHLVTQRIRALVHLAHQGNLSEASRATGLPYPTLRDLYVGRSTNPSYRTLEALADCYGIPLEWFREEEEPEEVPAEGRVGFLPPHPQAAGARPHLREVLIPFAAWPLYQVFTTLERRLSLGELGPARPIVGEASGDAFTFRLTTFLFQPLLAAEKAGAQTVIPEAAGGELPVGQRDAWVARLRTLGAMWEQVLGDLLGGG